MRFSAGDYAGDASRPWDDESPAAVALPPLNMALARYLVIHAIKNNKLAAGSALNPLDIAGLSGAGTGVQPDN